MDISVLKQKLLEKNYSIITDSGYTSFDNGIKPVIYRINENKDFFKDLTVVDKIIGKASAMMLTYSKVKHVYGLVMSKSAVEIFEKYGITYQYDELVPYIINRSNTGMCPMEETVEHLDDLKQALDALNDKIKQLQAL